MILKSPQPIVIIGAGGIGLEALWVIRDINASQPDPLWNPLGFADDNPQRKGELFGDLTVLGTTSAVLRGIGADALYHIGVGDNGQRGRLVASLEKAGVKGATLIHPTAVVASTAVVGEGSYVGAVAVIAPYARIGKFALINCSSGIGHHSVVDDLTNICPGARVNGYCVVDKYAFIGSNAVLHPGKKVGESATVGANSYVVRSVAPRTVVVGVPARTVHKAPTQNPSS